MRARGNTKIRYCAAVPVLELLRQWPVGNLAPPPIYNQYRPILEAVVDAIV